MRGNREVDFDDPRDPSPLPAAARMTMPRIRELRNKAANLLKIRVDVQNRTEQSQFRTPAQVKVGFAASFVLYARARIALVTHMVNVFA
jgi:hypothetical protein